MTEYVYIISNYHDTLSVCASLEIAFKELTEIALTEKDNDLLDDIKERVNNIDNCFYHSRFIGLGGDYWIEKVKFVKE